MEGSRLYGQTWSRYLREHYRTATRGTRWTSAVGILGPVELTLGVGWVSALDTIKHWGNWFGRMTLTRLLRRFDEQSNDQSHLEGG
jgi:hypothetical protein